MSDEGSKPPEESQTSDNGGPEESAESPGGDSDSAAAPSPPPPEDAGPYQEFMPRGSKEEDARKSADKGDYEGKAGKEKGEKEAKEDKDDSEPLSTAEAEEDLEEQAEERQKKREKQKKIVFGGGAALLILLVVWVFTSSNTREGSAFYGACRTFLELQIPYPQTLRVSVVQEISNFVRIWYAHNDAFGEFRLQPIQCYFERNDAGNWEFERVTISRRDLPQDIIDDFNPLVQIWINNPPDLTLPQPLPDRLRDLQIGNAYRPIF